MVRNEQTVLKIVVGASIPLPSGLSGEGWRARIAKPKTKIATLNSSNAIAYCFQFCGPVLIRSFEPAQPRRRPVAAVEDPGQVEPERNRQGDGRQENAGEAAT